MVREKVGARLTWRETTEVIVASNFSRRVMHTDGVSALDMLFLLR